jgi:hypothetical protein
LSCCMLKRCMQCLCRLNASRHLGPSGLALLTAFPGGPGCKMPVMSRPLDKATSRPALHRTLAGAADPSIARRLAGQGQHASELLPCTQYEEVPHQQVRDHALETRVVVAQPGCLAQQRHGPRLRASPGAHASRARTACAHAVTAGCCAPRPVCCRVWRASADCSSWPMPPQRTMLRVQAPSSHALTHGFSRALAVSARRARDGGREQAPRRALHSCSLAPRSSEQSSTTTSTTPPTCRTTPGWAPLRMPLGRPRARRAVRSALLHLAHQAATARPCLPLLLPVCQEANWHPSALGAHPTSASSGTGKHPCHTCTGTGRCSRAAQHDGLPRAHKPVAAPPARRTRARQ